MSKCYATNYNSSPHKGNGNTAVILDPFLQGMKEAGADISLHYTDDLIISACRGDLRCMTHTPGTCIHDDDMRWLFPKMEDADIWVLASPLYCDGVTGPMKTLMDRMVPLLQLFVELREDRCRHPLWTPKERMIVLVSNCGFWENESFDPVIAQTKAFAKNVHAEYAGSIIRPHGPTLKAMIQKGLPVQDVLDSIRDAGFQLIDKGYMDECTLNAISRPLKTRDAFLKDANEIIQNIIDHAMIHSESL
ncbi:flavodoxin family protein [Methanospirillum stamsii]|uniref:Flavodoxin family protein n=1 Tax=Methanospirillum stamsii TaxID=1277351 RepID=A0A2V2N158_9EURY|nr:flavodoxin family protein [Methanospirillum stamsii]PWR69897.1 flavodoxin family protein [Methanospirillum stamsii]